MRACLTTGLLAASLVTFAFSANTNAGGLPGANELKDIIEGYWCRADGVSLSFNSARLLVNYADGSRGTLRIRTVEENNGLVNIHWETGGNTVYDLSADKRVLVQLPNKTGQFGSEFVRC